MKRELIFRAWSKDDREWITEWSSMNGIDKDVCKYKGKHVFFFDYDDDQVSIMQYTGLKDKNGKEIYEGDIVKFHYFFLGGGEEGVWESEHQAIGVLTWGLYGWAVSSIRGEHWQGYTGYDAGEGESNILELMMMNESSIHEESFEIIGNIHENPELIK